MPFRPFVSLAECCRSFKKTRGHCGPFCHSGRPRCGSPQHFGNCYHTIFWKPRPFTSSSQFLLNSWRARTQSQNRTYIERWISVCLERKIDPFQPPLSFLLDYLLQEADRVQGRSYSSMNTIRSAISAVASIGHTPACRHPLVCRFMKAVFQIRPSFSRSRTTWDPDVVLTHIDGLGEKKLYPLFNYRGS